MAIRLADGSHLAELNEAQAHALIKEGVIYGGMIPKITACLDALADGPCVHIVDGSTSHVLLYEFEDPPHVGTTITRQTEDIPISHHTNPESRLHPSLF